MRNLAGDENADVILSKELNRCGIPIKDWNAKPFSDVPYTKFGFLECKHGVFSFHRYWYYWGVRGEIPLSVARKLYTNVVGKDDIRVNGHCGCPAPEGSALQYRLNGKEIIYDPDGKQKEDWDRLSAPGKWLEHHIRPEFSSNPELIADKVFVNNYHIDSELGLYIFVQHLLE